MLDCKIEANILFKFHIKIGKYNLIIKYYFSGQISVFPGVLPGLEELSATQPVTERVLHQAAEGPGQTRQGALLDH